MLIQKGIYKIINKINNKFYIGSSVNLAKRFSAHRNDLKKNKHCNIHLQNSWNKYGENNFDFLLEKEMNNSTEDEILETEQKYIDEYFDFGENCFNIAKVADRPDPTLAEIAIYQLDKNTKEIIREWASVSRARKELGITSSLYSCLTGNAVSMGGFCWRYKDEEKAKQFIAKQYVGPLKRPVYKIDDSFEIIKEYPSIDAAGKDLGISYTSIIGVCSGVRNTTFNQKFVYQDEYEEKKKEFLEKNKNMTEKLEEDNPEIYKCLACNSFASEERDKFTHHIKFVHKMKLENYVRNYLFKDKEIKCNFEECNLEPRFAHSEMNFKRYCLSHSYIAESEGGKKGGKISVSPLKGKTKETNSFLKEMSEKMKGENNPFFGKKHESKVIQEIIEDKILNEEEFFKRIEQRKEEFEFIDSYENYKNRQKTYLKFRCKECSYEQDITLLTFERGSLCKKCYPFFTSKPEKEICDYLESLGVELKHNVRDLIAPLELDIYLPRYNMAIEYHGLYWHSEIKGKHIKKYKECKEKGIRLIQIFGDEWENKKDIIKSMLKARLGMIDNRIFARKLRIKEIDVLSAKSFLNENHVSGYVSSLYRIGLVDNDDNPYAVLTIRKPFTKIYSDYYEIARYATKQNYEIVGGFSRLLKHVREKFQKSLISYCDLRYGTGEVYKKSNFICLNENTGEDYWYTDGVRRYNRFKFRADKENNMSEKEVADKNNVKRIFGAGNSLWILRR